MRFYDSRIQENVVFLPLTEGTVTIYVCGPTVQGSPHIGHLRTAYAYDTLVRWLKATGNEVTFVQNITDIDDKILANAVTQNMDWKDLAKKYELEFVGMYKELGLVRPTYAPHATDYIADIQHLISRLIERDYAYQATDGSANVYFDVTQDSEYGSFTHQTLSEMQANPNFGEAELANATGKKNPYDFAVWKAHKESEPITAGWDSTWGKGRPGWHVEDTAMAHAILGEQFDIHGGGRDLRLPHHEDEVAQARGAGYQYANYWIHSGLVTVNGVKMAKSKNNFTLAKEVIDTASPNVLRYLFTSTHYASDVEFSAKSLQQAKTAWNGISRTLKRAKNAELDLSISAPSKTMTEHMDNDLSTPETYAYMHRLVTKINSGMDQSSNIDKPLSELVWGLNALGYSLDAELNDHVEVELVDYIEKQIMLRDKARVEKNWKLSDQIRDELKTRGIQLEDKPTGTVWELLD